MSGTERKEEEGKRKEERKKEKGERREFKGKEKKRKKRMNEVIASSGVTLIDSLNY